jgi:hypothetical protein
MKKVLFLLVAVALVAGCSSKASNNPKEVAERFWSYSQSGDIEKAKEYATKGSASTLKDEDKEKPKGEFKLGEPEIEGDKAIIPTTIADDDFTMQLSTVLVKEDKKWKVDVNKTMMSMMGGAMGQMMKAMGEGMGAMMKGLGGTAGEGMKSMEEGMKGLGEQFGKSMGETMKQAGEKMREAGKKMGGEETAKAPADDDTPKAAPSTEAPKATEDTKAKQE